MLAKFLIFVGKHRFVFTIEYPFCKPRSCSSHKTANGRMTAVVRFKHCSVLPVSTSILNMTKADEAGLSCVLFWCWQCCAYVRMLGPPQHVMNSRSSPNGLVKTFVQWALIDSTQFLKSNCVNFLKVRREWRTTIFRLSPQKRSGCVLQANSPHTLLLYAPVNWRTTGEDDDVSSF